MDLCRHEGATLELYCPVRTIRPCLQPSFVLREATRIPDEPPNVRVQDSGVSQRTRHTDTEMKIQAKSLFSQQAGVNSTSPDTQAKSELPTPKQL